MPCPLTCPPGAAAARWRRPPENFLMPRLAPAPWLRYSLPAAWPLGRQGSDRPTAMPSGMLCRVTAVNKSVVRFQGADRPSGCFAPSADVAANPLRSKNPTPSKNPPAAGSSSKSPAASASVDGGNQKRPDGRGDHIAPAAKPKTNPLQAGGENCLRKRIPGLAQRGHQKVNPVPAAYP